MQSIDSPAQRGVLRSVWQQARGLLITMRPKQWTKNGFVFVALLFDGKAITPTYLLPTMAGFALLCMISSTVYLINDLVDIEADKSHPKKRFRPLPSGQLNRSLAVAAAAALPLIALPLGYLLRPTFAIVLLLYLFLQILYSFVLKHVVIIDVMTLAAGFVLRVVAGVVLVDVVRFSPWLYIFTTMLALFLGFAKRRQELLLLEDGAKGHRAILEQYNVRLLDELIMIATATTILTYGFYTFSAEGLPDNHLMMLTNPFVLYGIFRYLYLIHVKGEGGAPDEVLLTDRPLQVSVGLWGIAVFLILYVIPR